MWRKSLEDWLSTSSLSGFNQLFIEQLYEQYADNPESVDAKWRDLFEDLEASTNLLTRSATPKITNEHYAACELVELFRSHGHLVANIDPLKQWNRKQDFGFSLSDFNLHPDAHVELSAKAFGSKSHNVANLYQKLKETYSGTIAFQFNHIRSKEVRQWWIKHIESSTLKVLNSQDYQRLLKRVVESETFEKYLSIKYPGEKRFSLEGLESYIALLDELFLLAANNNYRDVFVSTAHRGRLNLLFNSLALSPKELFDAYAGNYILDKELFSNDVKYHWGRVACYRKENFVEQVNNKWTNNSYSPLLNIHLLYNPSHLEFVDGVLMGCARAKQTDYVTQLYSSHQEIPKCFAFTKGADLVLPIVCHGDSAFTGQGIVQETLNMSRTRAYSVGGCIHIVMNNQIGFTTSNPKDMRSCVYPADVARMIDAPIIHVNADDVVTVAKAAYFAFKYRQEFKRDVVIELTGYRRNGHNELDDPKNTQPQLYSLVDNHKIISDYVFANMEQLNLTQDLDLATLRKEAYQAIDDLSYKPAFGGLVFDHQVKDQEDFARSPMTLEGRAFVEPTTDSNLTQAHLMQLAQELVQIPDYVELPKTAQRIYQTRIENSRNPDAKLSWGEAELLSFASLLENGVTLRLSGEDSGRATFAHRHAVIHNAKQEGEYIPLIQMGLNRGHIVNLWDSTLSESAALGFEYGYSITQAKTLTMWEAQFGDFANGAQVLIDNFISSGETKWDQLSGLTMLLPHGLEGAGPEHSSCKPERFLALCAKNNMRVVCPTTAGQYYHILYHQGLAKDRKPLVLMLTKSFLRKEQSYTNYQELANQTWKPIICNQQKLSELSSSIKKLVLTNGRLRYDVEDYLAQNNYFDGNVFSVNLEQLYPFPEKELEQIIAQLPNLELIEWTQDESQNQGGWSYALPLLLQMVVNANKLGSLHINLNSRPSNPASAVGTGSQHKKEFERIVERIPTTTSWIV